MKWLLLALLAVALLGGGSYVLKRVILWRRLLRLIKPTAPFDSRATPEAPDYADAESWAVLPDRPANSVMTPPGLVAVDPRTAPADVFFVHPTTYYGSSMWNAPIHQPRARELVDELVIPAQASVFNGTCRIYAPRYRQATLYSFLDGGESGRRALETAYEDVQRAFAYFIEHHNGGRPFIVASHSQGTAHAIRLLEEKIDRTSLADRLIAAYVIGYGLPRDKFERGFERLHPCGGPTDLHCIVSWDTYSEKSGPTRLDRAEHWYPGSGGTGSWERRVRKPKLGVNPLSWTHDTKLAPREMNLGAVVLDGVWPTDPMDVLAGEGPLGLKSTGLSEPLPRAVSARCGEDGYLYISKPEDPRLRQAVIPPANYHNYDYSLFYMNLRKNVEERVAAFLEYDSTSSS
jgi:hypothetical protein